MRREPPAAGAPSTVASTFAQPILKLLVLLLQLLHLVLELRHLFAFVGALAHRARGHPRRASHAPIQRALRERTQRRHRAHVPQRLERADGRQLHAQPGIVEQLLQPLPRAQPRRVGGQRRQAAERLRGGPACVLVATPLGVFEQRVQGAHVSQLGQPGERGRRDHVVVRRAAEHPPQRGEGARWSVLPSAVAAADCTY